MWATATLLCWITTSFVVVPVDANGDDQTHLRGLQRDQARPVMHTFFTELIPEEGSGGTTAGMTTIAHNNMINTWKDLWQAAGWDTRVLTMEDAKQHPEFEQFHTAIRSFNMIEYDKACYYRWLAMAAVGGGWMSDYDTLPLNDFVHQGFDLPFQGELTSYENHVPSLLSGNPNEWLRMTRRLVEYASNHVTDNGRTPSDMHSLLALHEKYPNMFISRSQVAGRFASPEGDKWTDELCQQLTPRYMRAMHFSHAMIHLDWRPNHPHDQLDQRPIIERKWLENWLKSCGRQKLLE